MNDTINIGREDVLWNYAATFLQIGVGVILLPFILRVFPQETVAIWTIFTTIIALAGLLDFGFSPSFARNVSYVVSGVKALKVKGYNTVESDNSEIDYSLFKGLINIYNYPSTYSGINKHVNGFDVIMLHHSFEHMDNPREVLRQLYKLLKHEGQLLIRIPVSDSFAWRKYGVNWFQLDVPRHFFLHTIKSIVLLAKDCGCVLKQVIYDSRESQFLYSEKYCRDIASHTDIEFLPSYVRRCKKQAAYLNEYRIYYPKK